MLRPPATGPSLPPGGRCGATPKGGKSRSAKFVRTSSGPRVVLTILTGKVMTLLEDQFANATLSSASRMLRPLPGRGAET
eukprot:5196087-Amphidinium_carterae.1